MAVNPVLTGERRNQYTSSGSLGPYNFTFVIYADADLSVYVDDTLKTLSTHYTVSTNANGTGSITFTSGNAPASGTLVTIIGNKDISRTTRFTSGGPLTADALETEFNAQTALLQQLDEKISRAITLPIETDATRPIEFPYDNTEANNAGRLLKFNSAGSGLELGPTTTNVDALAAIAADISTVAGISADVTSVAADATDIGIVSTNIASVNTVATNINDVITVANDLNEAISEVETVADDLNEAVSEIDTVANNITDVQTVGNATNIANITTVAGQISPTNNISTVAGLNTEITTVSNANANITTIATNLNGSNTIGTVATDLSGSNTIGTVATNIASVQSVASNISGVNSFAERYRVAASDPTTSLDQGDLAFNTTGSVLKYYDGSAWQTVTAGGITDVVQDSTPQLGGNLDLNSNDVTGTGNVNITGNVSLTGTVDGRDVAADGTKLDTIATSATANPNAIDNVIEDLTPQLGGNLDVNGNSIVSASNGNISITPDGTGKVIIDGLSHPTSDGTADQVLKTDGAGNLSFADVSGGTSWQSSIVTGTTLSAVAGNGYWIDTTSNACTVTLPASASVGDTIEFSDYKRTWGTNNVTINQNSLNFQGNSSPNPVYDVNGQSVRIVYSGATQGWIPIVDDDVTLETPQSYTIDFLVIAGGGGGGGEPAGYQGGGGGAGGYRNSYSTESSGGGGSSETSLTLHTGTVYTITVGGGGARQVFPFTVSDSGGNSSISGSDITDIVSTGGGGGGIGQATNPGASGGSGGGGSNGSGSPGTGGSGGSGTSNQGFSGGSGFPHSASDPNLQSGGGGGAGGSGGNGNSSIAGDGGDGLNSAITGSTVARAGGGAGGTFNQTAGSAGLGGTADATSGAVNSGAGGGANASGGSGVVILRMADANYSGTTTGSPTVTTGVGGTDTVLVFTGNGSYTA